METSPPTHAIDQPVASWPLDPAKTLSALRALVGAASWASPALSWRTFGLGRTNGEPRSELVTRLFGARDLALGLAVKHPSPEVRRAALQVGVAVDALDVTANLLAFRRGAPRPSLALIGGGALLFVGLGVAALADERVPDPPPLEAQRAA